MGMRIIMPLATTLNFAVATSKTIMPGELACHREPWSLSTLLLLVSQG